LADGYQHEIPVVGVESPSFVRTPKWNGGAKRIIRVCEAPLQLLQKPASPLFFSKLGRTASPRLT
jgi:hypothetical protein